MIIRGASTDQDQNKSKKAKIAAASDKQGEAVDGVARQRRGSAAAGLHRIIMELAMEWERKWGWEGCMRWEWMAGLSGL